MEYKELASLRLPWEALREKNILVTGANGMIASALVESLIAIDDAKNLHLSIYAMCRNKERALSRFASIRNHPAIKFLIQDVIEPIEEDINLDYIIHAASSAHPDAMNNTPVDVMKSNFIGTLNLLEYCKKNPKCRFMFVSSSEVYGENLERTPIFTEDMPGTVDFTRFRACYPESKRASETLAFCYMKQYGTDIVIVRPAFIFGRDIIDSNTRADAYFLRQVMNHKDIVMYSEGKQVRSYLYVKDCVSAMLYVLLKGKSGEVYNIGDQDNAVTLKEYAEKLAKEGSVRVVFDESSKPAETVFLKTTQIILDTKKLQKLGWKPRYNIETGIKDILSRP